MAKEQKNQRGTALKAVTVIPTNIYRGILRITTKSQSVTAHETQSHEAVEEKDVLISASPSTINAAFDELIAEMVATYANPEMVKITLIEYRDLSTDNLCYTVA